MRVGATVALASCLALALALAAAPATAARKAPDAPTTIKLLKFTSVGPSTGAAGILTSPKPKCIVGRKVELVVIYTADEQRIDVGRSGKNGGWFARAISADFDTAQGIRLHVDPAKVGRGKSAVRCGADSVEVT